MHNTLNKIQFILFPLLVLILISPNVLANKLSCNTNNIDKFIGAENIKSIDISTVKSKKWVKNYLNAYKEPNKIILEKYKKKFLANISIRFNNDLECIFPSKIRINGDYKDHLESTPPIASLDVELLAGNINSTIKFKLFIPHTRGGENEVFATALLKELKFLAPKTLIVPATFNDIKTTFIFQEKITKEFIESNHLREAPILEGDERFRWNIDPNERALGLNPFTLARITNNKWIEKGYTSLNISKDALEQLNKAYLNYSSYQHFSNSNGENPLNLKLSDFINENYIKKEREFKAILIAIGSSHGLIPHNRSFYYDPIYRTFNSIYYDGDSTVVNLKSSNRKLDFIKFGSYLNNDEIIGSSYAIESLNKLNQKIFHKKLLDLGLKYSLEEVNIIVENIIINLENINNLTDKELQSNKSYKPYFSNYEKLKRSKLKLVFSTESELHVEICNLLLLDCQLDKLSLKKYSEVLKGRYTDDSENSYIFIGNKQKYLDGVITQNQSEVREFSFKDGAQLILYGSSKVVVNKKRKEIELTQTNVNDRFLIHGSKLTDWSIKFNGLIDRTVNNEQLFNQNLLTGCLTLLDLSVENISIEINGALCEDGVNFIRTQGDIKNIVVENALSDAIDADFSKINFNNISINNSGNDCVDLSYGNYFINYANLSGCKDKAISVGEKSKLTINLSEILNSNIGVAAKDSSVVKINNININSTDICFSAFNKKQEFWGGKIVVKKHNCLKNQVIQQKNSLVEFIE